MNMEDVVCERCGRNAMEVVSFGNFLQRVGPKGEPGIFVCASECGRHYGTKEDAVLDAIQGDRL